MNIKIRYLLFRSRIAVFVRSFLYKGKMSYLTRFKYAKKGFLPQSYYLYNLEKNDSRLYISDYQRAKSRFINKEDKSILNDKYIFFKAVHKITPTPTVFATIDNGKVKYNKDSSINSFSNLIEYLKFRKLILKPYRNSDGGSGVTILSLINKNTFKLNEYTYSLNDLKEYIKSLNEYIISEYITQGKFSAKFYDESTNTIRIITMKNPDTNDVFIAQAIYKIGTVDSKPVDNWAKGGIIAPINLETGVIGYGKLYKKLKEPLTIGRHPNSNNLIFNQKIPNWETIKKEITTLSSSIGNLDYIGWDVLLTEDGYSIIEGNNCPEVNILQIHQPLLTNEKVKRFYEYHGIIA